MSLCPAERLPSEIPPPGLESDNTAWYAVQTRSRSEKKVASQLEDKGIETFLPLLSEVHSWSDRRKLVRQPLFPNYVFVHVDHSAGLRLPILSTLGVCGFVGARGAGLPIPEKQILDIRTVVTNPVPFTPHPYLRAGQRVRLRGGCLDGIEGTLVTKKPDQTLVLSIELLRRSVAVRIDGYEFDWV